MRGWLRVVGDGSGSEAIFIVSVSVYSGSIMGCGFEGSATCNVRQVLRYSSEQCRDRCQVGQLPRFDRLVIRARVRAAEIKNSGAVSAAVEWTSRQAVIQ